ncbi:hypothetical protein RJI07_09255 [Mycoplasmatota bacterium WC30]
MKRVKSLAIFLIVLALSVLIISCGGDTTDSNITTSPEQTSIVGEYIVDITDLGMPLQLYLKIDSNDEFFLSSDRTYSVDKGHGTVGNSQDTYMLIYSDSTADNPKTSTFTMDNNNIHFSTNLAYGSSSLPASKVDENDPDITYYLVGKTLLYDDYYGEFGGQHSVTAMGGEINYEYFLKLGEGREFSYVSNFVMGGTDNQYTESGYFDIVNGQITLKIDGEDDVIGTFDSSKNLTIPVKPSSMGAREERVLQEAITAGCANTYYGHLSNSINGLTMYDTTITLVLDKFGGYSYSAVDTVSGTVNETGTFVIDENTITFSPLNSDSEYTATLENYVLNSEFLVSPEATSRLEGTLYCQTIQGDFSAEGEDELENTYQASLTLNNDGTFVLLITDDGDQTIISETGTFMVNRIMFVQLVLTASDETTYTCVVSEVGLNVNIDVDEGVSVGFILMKTE